MGPGEIGGIAGTCAGVLGGLIGTYFSFKNTDGARERAVAVRCSAICWATVIGFVALMVLLPSPWKWLLWIPYAVLLPLGIRKWNARQALIRNEEASQARGTAN